jgi:DNA invertase Pin-like site-specific DNA recombinase
MTTVAYSYIRFSSEPQAWGDSRRRQTALADRYAGKHGLALDKTLSFRDIGVSAFRGRNRRNGALGAFLDAVEIGVVSRGSYLLVESFDRLSRDHSGGHCAGDPDRRAGLLGGRDQCKSV